MVHCFTFLDVFIFVFFLQFIFYTKDSMLNCFYNRFLVSLKDVFSYNVSMPLSYLLSVFIFIVLLVSCFGGYFCYSFQFFSMIEFTFCFSLIAWMSTFLTLISTQCFTAYLIKSGDGYFKSLFLMLIELISEFSRPIALTVRLTANVMVGHLLVAGSYMLVVMVSPYFVFINVFLIFMESFVFFIQSYIFSRLIYFYLNE